MAEQYFEASAPSESLVEPSVATAVTPTRKQGLNIYTVMLVISFLSLVIGTIILFTEFNQFGGWDTSSAIPARE
ncbi:MAG TPA: hypothetical protein PKD64_11990 [Pirellulaceae bacterium]|nr:hypothetical protein [Pirellulaceae bacterium]HMO92906.1 hypothetical protein [Pirellulaceae bacterium]HMP69184.1 hypothetical protein [Pirellulaceae bacterium]